MKPPERLFSDHQRHKLRAQGRAYGTVPHSTVVMSDGSHESLDFSPSKQPRDSVSRSTQMLDFLARNAAESERALLAPPGVPDFAKVKSSPDSVELQARVLAKRRTQSRLYAPPVVAGPKQQSPLGLLANSLAAQANFEPEAIEVDSAPQPYAAFEAQTLTQALVGDTASLASMQRAIHERDLSERYAACMTDLDQWLGKDAEAQDDWIDAKQKIGALPAALPAIMPETSATGFDESSDERAGSAAMNVTARSRAEVDAASRARQKNSRYKRFLFNKNVLYKPRLMSLPNGTRRERFANGAELTKDAHGRVVEIRTTCGTSVQIHYDADGKPDSFIRLDEQNQAHSLGERDKHGVVVRDPDGRVRAAGESMAVDPNGCVSIRRSDGQFWSLDLLRGVHIERRCVSNADGTTHILTAVFAADGFRMVTRFQQMASGASDTSWLSDNASGMFRFYGRDGSVVQFKSEADLHAMKPARVWQPGARAVGNGWKFHQAGTAWEAVQEYITNYLLA